MLDLSDSGTLGCQQLCTIERNQPLQRRPSAPHLAFRLAMLTAKKKSTLISECEMRVVRFTAVKSQLDRICWLQRIIVSAGWTV